MKRFVLLSLMLALSLLFGCRKDNEFTLPLTSLVHIDPAEDSLILTCDSLVFLSSYNYHPVPIGDTNVYWFDLDVDGLNDLKVEARNYYRYYSWAVSYSAHYQANIELTGIDSTIEFSCYSSQSDCTFVISAEAFAGVISGEPSSLTYWSNNGYAMFHDYGIVGSNVYTGTYYLPWRRKVDANQYKYGWISFKNIGARPGWQYAITDWCWNDKVNLAIRPGQY